MSLRNFHLLFIFLSAGFSAGMAYWLATGSDPFGAAWTVPAAIASCAAAAGLIVYGIRFYKKTSDMKP